MLRPEILKKNRLMNAVTRHSVACNGSGSAANCAAGYPYIGCHDVFLFHAKDRFPSGQVKLLNDVTQVVPGIENLFIGTF